MRKQSGFSLIELVMFMVVVGVALASIGVVIQQNVATSAEPLLRQKGVALAGFYMDEILRKKWNENTPTGGGCVTTGSGNCTEPGAPAAEPTMGPDGVAPDEETRALFDDLDDYHDLNQSPTDQTGAALTDFAGYTVAVSVTEPAADWNTVDRRDVRIITVTVTTPTDESLQLTAYRVNF